MVGSVFVVGDLGGSNYSGREDCFALSGNHPLLQAAQRQCFARYNRAAEEDTDIDVVVAAATGGTGGAAAAFGPRTVREVSRVLIRHLGGKRASEIDIQTIKNRKLRNVVRQLFREEDTRPGGTAGEIRRAARAGVEDIGHYTKVRGNIRALEGVLRNRSLSTAERRVATAVLKDLRGAVREYDLRKYVR